MCPYDTIFHSVSVFARADACDQFCDAKIFRRLHDISCSHALKRGGCGVALIIVFTASTIEIDIVALELVAHGRQVVRVCPFHVIANAAFGSLYLWAGYELPTALTVFVVHHSVLQ